MENKNVQISKNLRQALSLDGQEVIQTSNNTISPVVDINKDRSDKFASSTTAVNGTATLLTTSSIKRTYVCGFTLAQVKDSTCNVATGGTLSIRVRIGGVIVDLAYLPVITLTTQENSVSLSFPPVEVDKNTAIELASGAHTLGVWVKAGSVSYFEKDY